MGRLRRLPQCTTPDDAFRMEEHNPLRVLFQHSKPPELYRHKLPEETILDLGFHPPSCNPLIVPRRPDIKNKSRGSPTGGLIYQNLRRPNRISETPVPRKEFEIGHAACEPEKVA